LIGILVGIDRPTSGKVVLEGVEISSLPEGQLARICNQKIGVPNTVMLVDTVDPYH
jgi:predicted ABC-type transport system involved in lysophospholipase L1 biosynthesis ATPase subunit